MGGEFSAASGGFLRIVFEDVPLIGDRGGPLAVGPPRATEELLSVVTGDQIERHAAVWAAQAVLGEGDEQSGGAGDARFEQAMQEDVLAPSMNALVGFQANSFKAQAWASRG